MDNKEKEYKARLAIMELGRVEVHLSNTIDYLQEIGLHDEAKVLSRTIYEIGKQRKDIYEKTLYLKGSAT